MRLAAFAVVAIAAAFALSLSSWIGCLIAFATDSDSANNALQAWDMLHGNLLLHGWIIGDATYCTFELPVFMITEAIFGLGSADTHIVAAVVYTLVIVSAIALARSGSRGMTAAVRTGIVLLALSIPLLLWHNVGVLLEKPDHTGTAAIAMLVLPADRPVVARWFIAPVVGIILILGQLGDATVLYVAVPTIALISLFRVIQARSLRTGDAAMLLAAVASVPLELLLRKAMLNHGGFLMVAPRTQLATSSTLASNWHFTLQASGNCSAPSRAGRRAGHDRRRTWLARGRRGGVRLRPRARDLAASEPGRAAAVHRDRGECRRVRLLDAADAQQSARGRARGARRRRARRPRRRPPRSRGRPLGLGGLCRRRPWRSCR